METEHNISNEEVIKSVAQEANMISGPVKVLAVDDEEFNLEILIKHLEKAGFETAEARSGEEAWEYLQSNPDEVDIILMDKMMPGISGIELTKKIKADPKLKDIVVIMQTASVGSQAVVEGIESGAYYYLTKPYAAEVLISIVSAAARDHKHQHEIEEKAQDKETVLSIIKKCEFEYKTVAEAKSLAVYLANFCPDYGRKAMGIAALLVNAVEHGNLGIGYEEKLNLLNDRKLDEDIERRLQMDENKDKVVNVKMSKEKGRVFIHIKDQGNGFNPQQYLDFDPTRMTDPNGRGIAMANLMENTTLEYLGSGNEVLLTVNLNPETKERA